jgi:hypothetical protein
MTVHNFDRDLAFSHEQSDDAMVVRWTPMAAAS